MSEQIVCIGEALVDFVALADDCRAGRFVARPGGSPLNTAVALRRLGAQASFAGKLSTDLFGDMLRDHLAAEGLDPGLVDRVSAPTALAFVRRTADEPAFTFYGEGTADALLAPADLPDALLDRTQALHVGSLGLLRERGRAAAVHAVQRLRDRALISVDPNIRPDLVADADEHRAFLSELFGQADLVKASAADLAWIAPGAAAEHAAAEILAAGPALVVVTLGAGGAFALLRGPRALEPLRVALPAFRVRVLDTVGAGDTFTAGLLAHLAAEGRSFAVARAPAEQALRAALRFAAAAAAICCTREGCDPPRRDEVLAFLDAAQPTAG